MNFYDIFDNIYVINLDRCTNRKKNIINEFKKIGINNYEFFSGIDKDSPEVTKMLNSSKVIDFPTCFRCKRNVCNCPNNCITRPQIGNWLSFLNIWRDIVKNRYKYVLICEDDICFTQYANKVLNKNIVNQVSNLKKSPDPVLIRLGWAKCNEHKFRKPELKSGLVRMANSFHCINNKMAKLLLNKYTRIYHTSDVYIHRDIPNNNSVKALTLLPPLTYGLSSVGDIDSTIHTREDPFYIKRLIFKRLLVVGTPQSGLVDFVNYCKTNKLAIANESMSKDGIASWMLAVDDTSYPFGTVGVGKKDGLIMQYYFHNLVHIITNPKETIPYILLEISKSKKALNFIKRHVNLPKEANLETACQIFLYWNYLIKKKVPKYTIKIDSKDDTDKFSQIFKFDKIQELTINRKTTFKKKDYPVPNITDNEYRNLSSNTRLKLDKFCVEYSYPRFINLRKSYKVIDLLIIGPGGVGCSYFLRKVADETNIRTNKKGDIDGLKHIPSPARIKQHLIIKKALFIFNDPLLAIKSHFRRKWHMYQISKLGNPYKFNTRRKLSYPAYCKKVEGTCKDMFGIEYQYDNWVNDKKDFPVMFAHFPDIKNNAKIISKFTGLNKQFFDTFEIKDRKCKESNESELVKKVYEDLYNKMLDRGEYYIL